jgi:hypothetical protein
MAHIYTPTTTVRLPRSLVEQMRIIAKAHERSISAELRVALDAYVRDSLQEAKQTLEERTR